MRFWRALTVSTVLTVAVLVISPTINQPTAAPRARLNPVVPTEDELREVETQYREQFRTFVRLELQFIDRACRLDPQQRTQLRDHGDRILNETANFLARALFSRKLQRDDPDLWNQRRWIREELYEAAQNQLPAAQVKILNNEIERRLIDNRQAALRSFIADLDTRVQLSAAQRTALLEAMSATWNHYLFQHSGTMTSDDRLPIPIRKLVELSLNEKQQIAWRTFMPARAVSKELTSVSDLLKDILQNADGQQAAPHAPGVVP